ncbi:hypothetical protein AKO1_005294 [Acrasis kona]|uniref:RGS domain-containing protein n=1 Tax=Acrasis kona TaxID=1008807 RepID=A0AAW2YJ24_9EUKA
MSTKTSSLKNILAKRRKINGMTLEVPTKLDAIQSPGSTGTPASPSDPDVKYSSPAIVVASASPTPNNVVLTVNNNDGCDLTLRFALNNAELHGLISTYAQKEFKYEYVLVYDNILRFKRARLESVDVRANIAKYIYETFLSVTGSLKQETSHNIKLRIDKGDVGEDLFDVLEIDLESKLRETFENFKRTKECEQFVRCNGSPLRKSPLVARKPPVGKLNLSRSISNLSVDTPTKREMSPTVGLSERYVGSPTIRTDSLHLGVKSPKTITSPTVGDTPRFVCSPVVRSPEGVFDFKNNSNGNSKPSTPNESSPKTFFISLLSQLKKRRS